jgi:hypothetical protein
MNVLKWYESATKRTIVILNVIKWFENDTKSTIVILM